MTKLKKKSNRDQTQKLKFWQNSRTQIVTKLKKKSQNSNAQTVTILKNSNCDKTQYIKMCQLKK